MQCLGHTYTQKALVVCLNFNWVFCILPGNGSGEDGHSTLSAHSLPIDPSCPQTPKDSSDPQLCFQARWGLTGPVMPPTQLHRALKQSELGPGAPPQRSGLWASWVPRSGLGFRSMQLLKASLEPGSSLPPCPRGLCLALFRWASSHWCRTEKENPIKPSRKEEGTACGVVSGGGRLNRGLKMRNTGQEGPTWRRSLPLQAPVERGCRTGGGFQPALTPSWERRFGGAGSEQRAPAASLHCSPRDFLSFAPAPGVLGRELLPQPTPLSLTLLMGQLGPMQPFQTDSLIPRAASSCLWSLSQQGGYLRRWAGGSHASWFKVVGGPAFFSVRPMSTYSQGGRGGALFRLGWRWACP